MAVSTSLNIDTIDREVVEDYYSTNVMMKMLSEGLHSDITLEACGSSVKAHRCVLAGASSVFRAMFEHEMKEQKTSTVEISDMSMEGLQLFLVLLYVSACNNGVNVLGFDDAVVKHWLELFHASHKYDVTDRLECILLKTLPQALTPDNLWDYIKRLSEQPFGSRTQCIYNLTCYIEKNFDKVMESESTRLEMERNFPLVSETFKRVVKSLQPFNRNP